MVVLEEGSVRGSMGWFQEVGKAAQFSPSRGRLVSFSKRAYFTGLSMKACQTIRTSREGSSAVVEPLLSDDTQSAKRPAEALTYACHTFWDDSNDSVEG